MIKFYFFSLALALLCFSLSFAQTPIRSYSFNGNFNETGGGPSLVAAYGLGTFVTESYCGTTKTVYQFGAGQGLQLNEPRTGDYTIEMFVKMSNVSSYNRLLDFKNLVSDCGIYTSSGSANFYCVTSGGSLRLSKYKPFSQILQTILLPCFIQAMMSVIGV